MNEYRGNARIGKVIIGTVLAAVVCSGEARGPAQEITNNPLPATTLDNRIKTTPLPALERRTSVPVAVREHGNPGKRIVLHKTKTSPRSVETKQERQRSLGHKSVILGPESFETSVPPAGWSQFSWSSSANHWFHTASPIGSGWDSTYVAWINYDAANPQNEVLQTPEMDLSGYSACSLSFLLWQSSSWDDTLRVLVSFDGGGSAGQWYYLDRFSRTGDDWNLRTLYMTACSDSPSVVVGFNYLTATSDQESEGIDYVTITGTRPLPNLVPYCPAGWSSPIVCSVDPDMIAEDTLAVGEPFYISWAIVNLGDADIEPNDTFYISVYDTSLAISKHWFVAGGLQQGYYIHVDTICDTLHSPGSYEMHCYVDLLEDIPESNENDNDSSRTYHWKENPNIHVTPESLYYYCEESKKRSKREERRNDENRQEIYERIEMTRWISPDSSKPTTFEEWQATQKTEPWAIKCLYSSPSKQDYGCVVIVETSLVDSILGQLMQLKDDLEAEGESVVLVQATGGTPPDIRNYLKTISGLKGALLVGELPVAWYQMISSSKTYDDFPCDLYFMDLDGVWLDDSVKLNDSTLTPGSDGVFDGHTGDVAPEIFVGMLRPGPIGNSISLLKSYFSKAHNYRIGSLSMPDSALVYVDDDWAPWHAEWRSAVELLYPHVAVVADPETTIADDYRNRIQEQNTRAWISLFAHSWPGGHAFTYNQGTEHSWFYATEIPGLDPEVLFYNLFCCSNCRYVESGYCGGRYIFSTTAGLDAIGSTKAGSMLLFEYFYGPLGGNASMGGAFKQWFQEIAEGGFSDYEKGWHYGMTLLGDPFLRPAGLPWDQKTLCVHNIGDDTLNVYSITCAQSWIDSVSPRVFKVSPGDCQNVMVTVDASGLPNGFHYGTLRIFSNDPDEDLYFEPVVLEIHRVGIEEDNIVLRTDSAHLLSSSLPNPFAGQTQIEFHIPVSSEVSLEIYDIGGRFVRGLTHQKLKAGKHNVRWDGKNNDGRKALSGIYFYRLKVGDSVRTSKMTLIR